MSTDAFSTKVGMDLKLFQELLKNYIEESELPAFKNLLTESYLSYKELLQETSVVPVPSIIALRKKKVNETITENEVTSIIYEAFRKDLEKNFVKPLQNGEINSLYESEMGNIFKIVVNSDTDLDPEISRKYAIFEKVVKDTISNIILPNDNLIKMNDYASKLDGKYFEVFDRTIREIKQDFNESVEKFANNLACKMFKKGIQFGAEYNKDEFELEKYKGLSAFLNKKDILDETLSKFPEKVKEDHDSESLDSDDIDELVNK